ncbi:MAG: hypothetical protein NC244_07700 [Alistipes senegalensis]|nr:hypothetical protein [Alistipes senegalensis]
MKIEHFNGVTLEHIVSSVFSCDRGGLGGIVDSDIFEHKPLLAAYLVIAKLYNSTEFQDKQIETFINKWETIFEYPLENEEHSFKEYADELRKLIKTLKQEDCE